MDWKQAIEKEKVALQRVVALLLSLAGLAELACAHSAPIRFFVLWVLRRAEAVARNWVMVDESRPLGLLVIGSLFAPLSRSSPADAMRLAQSFRELAHEIEQDIAGLDDYADEPSNEPRDDWPVGTLGLVDFINMDYGRSEFLDNLAGDASLAAADAQSRFPLKFWSRRASCVTPSGSAARNFCAHPT